MTDIKITPISFEGNVVGEAPHWVEKDKSLVYIDIDTSNLYRYYTETSRLQKLHLENAPSTSFIVPFEGRPDEFAVGAGSSVASVTWSPSDPDDATKKASPLVAVDQHCTGTRMNDAKCDPRGRLWAGTMPSEQNSSGGFALNQGTLYRIDSDFKATEMIKKVSISNGLAWDHSYEILYFIDTLNYSVDAFDYNNDTGDIANRRVVLDCKTLGFDGLPDGLTIDINGNLWVCFFNGWKMIVLDPRVGKVARSIKLPSCNVTSCCWGGPDYSTLYVTSGTKNRCPEELASYPDSGKTFAVTGLGTKGKPPTNYHVDLKLLNQLKKQ